MDGLICSCGKPATYHGKFKLKHPKEHCQYQKNPERIEIEMVSCAECLIKETKKTNNMIRGVFTALNNATVGSVFYPKNIDAFLKLPKT